MIRTFLGQATRVLTFINLADLVLRDLALLARQVLRLIAVDQLLDARLEGLCILGLAHALGPP